MTTPEKIESPDDEQDRRSSHGYADFVSQAERILKMHNAKMDGSNKEDAVAAARRPVERDRSRRQR